MLWTWYSDFQTFKISINSLKKVQTELHMHTERIFGPASELLGNLSKPAIQKDRSQTEINKK